MQNEPPFKIVLLLPVLYQKNSMGIRERHNNNKINIRRSKNLLL